ncbi:Rieske (2Fe-2S) protein [Streptomyces sp. DG2A-72]|uniref:Rieske (2Fe-2S) protein n=1 Tax=Streptomyces sp. DG2A-72 TaxID=3051386 RepID=UPI00265BF106|nr:Rieske (2Fe-2S) protein [Streptomyces sp. DG2A-72]MDO0931412.1 Rieske (2Fe-2S) protein [Streptomyces sp. DG2A-72]
MTSESVQPVSAPSRRTVVAAVGAAGLAVALTACGSEDDASGSSTEQGADASSPAAEGGAGGAALAKTSDIPEGSGKVFSDEKVVVSQPTAGDYKAYSTICTHQGCPMTDLKEDIISCACHGSTFSIADGSVQKGPATKPLEAKEITVSGDSITLA